MGDADLPTEDISPRFADLDVWKTHDAVEAMVEDQIEWSSKGLMSQLKRLPVDFRG